MWDAGYISEINYVYGYFAELAPERLKLALLSRGIAHTVAPEPTYLELGFGQGLSLAINAATNPGNYYGTDFNPGQVANARELAIASGKQLHLFENSFEELARRTDLPEFDIIALHGIWSWIPEASREAILRIASERLKPGGIFYISYNVAPGWSPAVPLRHLLSIHAKRAGQGNILERVEQSIGFVESVMDANAAYFDAHPQLRQRLEQIKTQDKTYVSHEYFNAHWDPMPFSVVADRLAEAKLTFGASANILDNLESISVPPAASEILSSISDPVLRETTRDYFVNQQFRRDIFVKGPRSIPDFEMAHVVDGTAFVALGKPDKRPNKIATSSGEADLIASIYQPVVDVLTSSKDGAATVGEIQSDKRCKDLNRGQVWEALLVLTASGFAGPSTTSKTDAADASASKALNQFICERAQYTDQMRFLAAPAIGSAISISRIDQLFLQADRVGAKDIPVWVWSLLESQGQSLIKDGKTLVSSEQNIAELRSLYNDFMTERRPILETLGAVSAVVG